MALKFADCFESAALTFVVSSSTFVLSCKVQSSVQINRLTTQLFRSFCSKHSGDGVPYENVTGYPSYPIDSRSRFSYLVQAFKHMPIRHVM